MLIANNVCASIMQTNPGVPEFKRETESVQRAMKEVTSNLINVCIVVFDFFFILWENNFLNVANLIPVIVC